MGHMQTPWAEIRRDAWLPAIGVALLWILHAFRVWGNVPLEKLALDPRSFHHLWGVIGFPLVHGDWIHVYSNAVPLLVLGWMLRHFYRPISLEVLGWIWLMNGVWLWIIGQPGTHHIGASGLVYGLAGYPCFQRNFSSEYLFKHHQHVGDFSLRFFGSGVLPIDPTISWEGHLTGLIAGILVAFIFRRSDTFPKPPEHNWDDDPSDDDPYWLIPDPSAQPPVEPNTGENATGDSHTS
jgi:membrane associated rhomboid family serine protease